MNPEAIKGNTKVNDLTVTCMKIHEIGHNVAYLFYHDPKVKKHYEYFQNGLQSNYTFNLFPTSKNTENVINDEYNRSQLQCTH